MRAEHGTGGFARVYWTTTSEYNSSHFDVYRSTYGVNFQNVGKVNAAGNTQSIRNYEFMDDISALVGGKVYYKLKQVDFNGSFAWTQTVDITIKGSSLGLSISPNPASSALEIHANGLHEGDYAVKIYDMRGKLVQTETLQVTEYSGTKRLNVGTLPVGIYHIQINGESIKLLIAR